MSSNDFLMIDHLLKMKGLINENLPAILSLRSDFIEKSDGSYVSKGDILVQDLILNYCDVNLSDYHVISEEKEHPLDFNWEFSGKYIIIDPIDGTENFVSGLKEWGVGISCFEKGLHQASLIYLPEINDYQVTGAEVKKFKSRIIGISSSLKKEDLELLPLGEFEFRIIGCSMYNTLSAVRGAFAQFENFKGVNCWDILPGLNLALEHGCSVWVDDKPYQGQILFPVKKYKIKISNLEN